MFNALLNLNSLIIIGTSRSFKSSFINNLDIFNDYMICVIGLNLYLFTDFINIIEIQELNGWLMCGLVSFFMLVNIIPILGNLIN